MYFSVLGISGVLNCNEWFSTFKSWVLEEGEKLNLYWDSKVENKVIHTLGKDGIQEDIEIEFKKKNKEIKILEFFF